MKYTAFFAIALLAATLFAISSSAVAATSQSIQLAESATADSPQIDPQFESTTLVHLKDVDIGVLKPQYTYSVSVMFRATVTVTTSKLPIRIWFHWEYGQNFEKATLDEPADLEEQGIYVATYRSTGLIPNQWQAYRLVVNGTRGPQMVYHTYPAEAPLAYALYYGSPYVDLIKDSRAVTEVAAGSRACIGGYNLSGTLISLNKWAEAPVIPTPGTKQSQFLTCFQIPWEHFSGISYDGVETMEVVADGGEGVRGMEVLVRVVPYSAPKIFKTEWGQNDTIIFYMVGLGPVTVPQTTGAPAADNIDTAMKPLVTINGIPREVTRSSLAVGEVGLYVVEVRIADLDAINTGTFEIGGKVSDLILYVGF